MHIIGPHDIAPFADIPEDRLEAMIADAEALAVRAAPCLATTSDPAILGAARAILRGAVLRWHEAGNGAIKSQTAGPFNQSIDTTIQRRGMFWPSEITDLEALCRGANQARAYSFTPSGHGRDQHADVCSLSFGTTWCDCGADLNPAHVPIWAHGDKRFS